MRTKTCLTADDVKKMLAAAEIVARAHGWGVAIVILDDGAHPMGLLRLDGATAANVDIAMAKAHTAARMQRPTKAWADRLEAGNLLTLALPVMPAQGGLPIMLKGECIGAIAASGVKGEEDEQVAQAGIDALNL